MIIWNRILVGMDEASPSMEAVRYLAAVLGGSANCQIRLLAVMQPPQDDRYPDKKMLLKAAASQEQWLRDRMERALEVLVETGIPAENLSMDLTLRGDRTIGEAIMDYQAGGGYGTVVVGRRGLSKAEEFLFGSTSNTVVHRANNCCVWVVS